MTGRAGGIHSAQEILTAAVAHDARVDRRRSPRPVQPHTRPIVLLPCGTDAAYLRHYRHGETPCDACKAAHAQVSYQRRRRTGQVKPYNLYVPANVVPLVIEAARASGLTTADWCRDVLVRAAIHIVREKGQTA